MFKWKTRYIALSIIFFSSVVMGLDRMIISTAIPYMAKDLGLSPVQMGAAMSAFFIGYTTLQIPGGILVHKFGPRKIMLWGIAWWTAFTVFTGAIGSFVSMIIVRALFGAGEGVFPAAAFQTLANWFPKKERGTAVSIMTSCSAWGPALAPIIAALIISAYGWRETFYFMALPGIVLIIWIWYSLTDDPAQKKGISAQELAEIREEVTPQTLSEAKYSLWQVLRVPAVWQSCLILFLFDIGIWGFRTWLPTYLVQARGFSLMKMGVVASLPFFAGGIGYIVGGWLSDKIFPNNRKAPIIICQWISAIFLYLTFVTESPSLLVAWLTCAGFFLCVAFGAFWALPMITLSKSITGRGMSIINTGGQIAGASAPLIIGFLVQTSGGGFGTTFGFMIAGVLLSSLFALMVKTKRSEEHAKAV
ncbi:MAG: sauU 4 [Firmicutes bacterium]|nr:sauU 4 [Bacillota bacterium]